MKPYPNVVIRASAGTGKTFQLSNRYLGLLDRDSPPDQILATTFTRKAAGEILDRVVVRLAKAALDDKACKELAGYLDTGKLSRGRCLELLEQLTRNLHRLRISTLDSFFSQLAGSFSLELGLPPGWRIVEELRDARLRTEAIETILRDSSGDVARLMNLLTKGEAERSVSELVRSTVNSLYNLYLETSPEAWRRFPHPALLSSQALSETAEALRTVELPADKRFEKARENDFQSAAENDWETFITKGLAAKVLEGQSQYYKKEIPEPALAVYKRLVGHAKGVLVDQLAKQTEATHELLHKFDAVYQQLKHRARALRFEDVTRCLSNRSALGDVQRQEFRLDAPIAHLLLDEFQDTSLAQWQVIRPFAERVTSGGGQQSLFCVGDVKQAIYGWRGGLSEIFDALESNLSGLTRDWLNQSYRSSPPIIETVNRVFAGITSHPNLDSLGPGVERWCGQFNTHTTAKSELHGYACLESAPQAGEDDKQQDVTLEHAARRIAELVAQAPGYSVGVLARRNSVVGQMIFLLRRLGVPASEEGGNPLTDSAAVQVVLSLLRMSDHPGDLVSRFHVAQSPLGPSLGLTDYRRDDDARQMASRVRRELLADGYGPTIYGYATKLAASCNRRDLSRLQQLVELAYGFQSTATLRPADFLRYVERERVADPTTADVRVMTIHQAKGLEFDIVVLADLDTELIGHRPTCVVGQPDPTQPVDRVCLYRNASVQALLPDDLQQLFTENTSREISEALCVLYVSITRAIHALHMIVAPAAKNERSLRKTSAGLLRAALTDGSSLPPETIVYEHGDREWFGEGKAPAEPALAQLARQEPRPPETAQPLMVRLAPPTGTRSVGLERTSPSSLEGGPRIKLASVLRLDNSQALARGTLIHAWFEQIQWLDDGPPTDDELRQVAAKIDTAGLDVEQALTDFRVMLEAPAIAAALRRDFYQPARNPSLAALLPNNLHQATLWLESRNEQRFAVRDGNHILNGNIDRLVLIYHADQLIAADILDYKTDVLDPNDSQAAEAKIEFYRPQLAAYRRAVGKLFRLPLPQISTCLLLLAPGLMRDVTK
jgi:ATP-dependent helicase/nuclease subunit A